MIDVTPVILCGGAGTRLWPLSRTGFPKQFLCLTGSESLFQNAGRRLSSLADAEIRVAPTLIVTGEEHRFLAYEQMREVGIEAGGILLEPVGRNTAPALTLAGLFATENDNDPVMVVTPSDQAVVDTEVFVSTMRIAIREAANGGIVVLGVVPDRPKTGYGYIQIDKDRLGDGALNVRRFVEKPDRDTAKRYLDEGSYYWNAGMFVLKASVWLKALEHFRPDILEGVRASWAERSVDSQFIRPAKAEFSAIRSQSVDYAVMEQCPGSDFSLKMVPLAAGWNDLGSWDAVWNVLPKDEFGNACAGDVLISRSSNMLVQATSRLVGLVGVSDLVVIETPDAVLVADKSSSQEVKQIVSALYDQNREEHTLHRKVHRPWGWYDNVDAGERFKVKRIQVKPGASLSLQKHRHRAEHWIVVKGIAEITKGGTTVRLTENQSTYIPLGEVHRLANPGSTPLEIIEVQSGSYLGEDDIVRIEDNYGRKE